MAPSWTHARARTGGEGDKPLHLPFNHFGDKISLRTASEEAPMANNVPDIPSSLVEALRAARHVAALTGSGISAESGVPTFRDPQDGL